MPILNEYHSKEMLKFKTVKHEVANNSFLSEF